MPKDLINTGERLHAETFDMNALEHLHRYTLASNACRDLDVLDIASGEGYGSNLLSKVARTVHGVDISADAVLHAQHKYTGPNIKFHVGSADAIPLPNASVDGVVSFETLEHHEKHEEMFSEIRRVLRPGGFLIMSTPDKLNYTDKPGEINPFHVKELYFDEFLFLARRHFQNVEIYVQRAGYFDLITPNNFSISPFEYYAGDFEGFQKLSAIRDAHYNICIASDGDLPTIAPSAYEGYEVYDNLLRLSRQRKNEIDRLERGLASAEKQLTDIKSSLSFRIGSIVTLPIRKLRTLAHRPQARRAPGSISDFSEN